MDKKILVGISHNTENREYRRAGIIIYDECHFHEVTAEQLKILQNDPRVCVHKVKTTEDAVKK
jgi:hypothetical protein